MTSFHEIQTQKHIYDLLVKHPGLYASKIAEHLNLKLTEVETHLRFLEAHGFIESFQEEDHQVYQIKKKKTTLREKRIIKTQEKIYDLVASHPGLHVSKIAELLQMPRSTVEYYLRSMEKEHLLIVMKKEGYRRYYHEQSTIGSQEKQILSILNQELPCKIVLYLLKHPNTRHKELCNALHISSSLLSYHLNKLINHDIVDVPLTGEGYQVKNREEILSYLQRYHFSSLVDRFAITWEDID